MRVRDMPFILNVGGEGGFVASLKVAPPPNRDHDAEARRFEDGDSQGDDSDDLAYSAAPRTRLMRVNPLSVHVALTSAIAFCLLSGTRGRFGRCWGCVETLVDSYHIYG